MAHQFTYSEVELLREGGLTEFQIEDLYMPLYYYYVSVPKTMDECIEDVIEVFQEFDISIQDAIAKLDSYEF